MKGDGIFWRARAMSSSSSKVCEGLWWGELAGASKLKGCLYTLRTGCLWWFSRIGDITHAGRTWQRLIKASLISVLSVLWPYFHILMGDVAWRLERGHSQGSRADRAKWGLDLNTQAASSPKGAAFLRGGFFSPWSSSPFSFPNFIWPVAWLFPALPLISSQRTQLFTRLQYQLHVNGGSAVTNTAGF